MAHHTQVPRPGETVASRFQIDREIGRGGFSVVYEATQLNLGRHVAIKMLLPEILGDAYNIGLFKREARFAKSLRHPYIIELYDYGETHRGLPFIVMELLKGEAMGDAFGRAGMDPQRLWRITAQVLKALMAAHRQGVVHRDIKPSNIFICDFSGMTDFVKVIDFGIAKAFTGPGETSTTSTGKVVGTPHYMAPEQIQGEGLGPHSDLYALGLVMAEAITGQSVFPENAGLMDILRGQMSEDPPPFTDGVKQSVLWPIIDKACQKKLEHRYRTAAEMLEDVERVEFGRVSVPSVSFLSYAPEPEAPRALPPEGTLIDGRFRLDALISRRPFTGVYRGTQMSLDRPVAIKILLPEALEKTGVVESFEQEALTVRQLHNPHTIRIVDCGRTQGGLPYLAFEWLRGLQLSAVLQNVRLIPSQVRHMARQVLASLREAHQKGVVHRDIRPTSIFLCDVGLGEDFAKLTDFGQPVSQIGSTAGLIQLSDTQEVLGAPYYMAPEQLVQGHIGPHSDIYSLGLVMAEAIAGQPVFDRGLDPIQVARMQASDAPPPIPSRVLMGHLGAIIERATRKELALRYATVDEMLADLDLLDAEEAPAIRTPTQRNLRKPVVPALTGGFRAVRKPKLKWAFETGGHVRSSPVLGEDGTLYFGSFDGRLYAVYPSGELRWQFQTQGEIRSSPALDAKGNVYVGSRDARIYAISPAGQALWAYETVGPVHSSPVVGRDGTIYAGSGDRYIYALRSDGTPDWFVATKGPVSSTPALGSDGTIYVGSEDKRLYAIDPSGQIKWKIKTGGRIYGSPAADARGTVYVGSEDEYLYALTHEGKVKWGVQMEFFIASTPVIAPDGTVYIGANDGTVYAISPEGLIKWTYQAQDSITAAPNLDAAGNIYVGSNDGRLYSISPDGALNWAFDVGDWIQSSPVIAIDGTIVFGADDGKLYAITEA